MKGKIQIEGEKYMMKRIISNLLVVSLLISGLVLTKTPML